MIELGLQRISRLLAETPLPWRAIHVAGTNGKGSICSYISSMLETYNKSDYRKQANASPLKHARFTSPHLIDRWDCITINQEAVPFTLFDHVEKRVLLRNEREGIKASEFEVLTATAFEIFTHEKVDVGVIEVGMGGRLDATNVLGQPLKPPRSRGVDPVTFRAKPLVTAISKIGLDHQAFLGSTLSEIAAEKAGIVKPGVPVTYDASNETEVRTVLDAKAAEAGSSVAGICDDRLPTVLLRPGTVDQFFGRTELPWLEAHKKDVGPSLQRQDDRLSSFHLQHNLRVAYCAAWTALQQLGAIGPHDGHVQLDDSRQQALTELATDMIQNASQVVFPGRLQLLTIAPLTGRKQDMLLDGAHNAQSAAVLAGRVDDLRREVPGDGKVTWVIAASDTKDIEEILTVLLTAGDSVFAVEFGPVAGMPWVKAMSGRKIVEAVERIDRGLGEIKAQSWGSDVLGALRAASEKAAEQPLVAAGSLYLVGDILRLLRDAR